MSTEILRIQALNICIEIANDYTKQEVEKFCPPSVQRAWEIGNTFLGNAIKEDKKHRKDFVI